jgi:hypothetical protein
MDIYVTKNKNYSLLRSSQWRLAVFLFIIASVTK